MAAYCDLLGVCIVHCVKVYCIKQGSVFEIYRFFCDKFEVVSVRNAVHVWLLSATRLLHICCCYLHHMRSSWKKAHSRISCSVFMLPCIVIDFFLNNQPGALINRIYSVTKLYMFRASSLPINRSSCQDGTSFILTLLGYGHHKSAWNLPVPNVSRELLMMGREDARNM